MKRYLPIFIAALLLVMVTTTVFAGSGYPWQDRAAPYDFEFGNHIDVHQQSKAGWQG